MRLKLAAKDRSAQIERASCKGASVVRSILESRIPCADFGVNKAILTVDLLNLASALPAMSKGQLRTTGGTYQRVLDQLPSFARCLAGIARAVSVFHRWVQKFRTSSW